MCCFLLAAGLTCSGQALAVMKHNMPQSSGFAVGFVLGLRLG